MDHQPSFDQVPLKSLDGRQYAFTHLVRKLPLTTPMSATWNVHGTGALGQNPSFSMRKSSVIGRPVHIG